MHSAYVAEVKSCAISAKVFAERTGTKLVYQDSLWPVDVTGRAMIQPVIWTVI